MKEGLVKLPNADQAQVERAKVEDYLLDPAHPDGWGKARFFSSVGFQLQDWQVLASALRKVALESTVCESTESRHGREYVLDGTIATPSGRSVVVRTIWVISAGAEAPRLVSAYPRDTGD
jgi:hypothetical protein